MSDANTPAPTGPEKKEYFRAYRETPVRRIRLPIRSIALLLFAFGAWFALQRDTTQAVVVTKYGMRTVKEGMTQSEVKFLIGSPIASTRNGDLECLKYGEPTLDKPFFLVHSLCYDDGKLETITSERFVSARVESAAAKAPEPVAPELGRPAK
jgi:hypothetical protein